MRPAANPAGVDVKATNGAHLDAPIRAPEGTRAERTNVFVVAAFEPLRLGLTTAISDSSA